MEKQKSFTRGLKFLTFFMCFAVICCVGILTGCDEKHNLQKVEAVPSTCTSEGIKEHWKCTDCDKIFDAETKKEISSEDLIIPVLELEYVPGVPATFASEGVREHWKCKKCGKLYKRNIATVDGETSLKALTIPKLLLIHIEKLEPTCMEEGNIEHWAWNGKFYADKNGTREINAESIILDKLPLTHVDRVEPTFTKEGCQEYWYCKKCNKIFSSPEASQQSLVADKRYLTISKLKLELVESKPATCTEEGNITYYKYGNQYYKDNKGIETLTLQEIIIPKIKLNKVEAKPATCTENGNVLYYVCPVCGKKFLDKDATKLATDVVLNALEHSWSADKYDYNNFEYYATCLRHGCGERKTISSAGVSEVYPYLINSEETLQTVLARAGEDETYLKLELDLKTALDIKPNIKFVESEFAVYILESISLAKPLTTTYFKTSDSLFNPSTTMINLHYSNSENPDTVNISKTEVKIDGKSVLEGMKTSGVKNLVITYKNKSISQRIYIADELIVNQTIKPETTNNNFASNTFYIYKDCDFEGVVLCDHQKGVSFVFDNCNFTAGSTGNAGCKDIYLSKFVNLFVFNCTFGGETSKGTVSTAGYGLDLDIYDTEVKNLEVINNTFNIKGKNNDAVAISIKVRNGETDEKNSNGNLGVISNKILISENTFTDKCNSIYIGTNPKLSNALDKPNFSTGAFDVEISNNKTDVKVIERYRLTSLQDESREDYASLVTANTSKNFGNNNVAIKSKEFTLTFDANGGKIKGDGTLTKSYVCKQNEIRTADTFSEAIKDGVRFRGWYTAKEGGEELVKEKITKDTTYYAQWMPYDNLAITQEVSLDKKHLILTIQNNDDESYDYKMFIRFQGTNKDNALKLTNFQIDGIAVSAYAYEVNGDFLGYDVKVNIPAGGKIVITSDITATQIRNYTIKTLSQESTSASYGLNILEADLAK